MPLLGYSQQTTNTVSVDGTTRQYIQYVPAVYQSTDTVAVLFSLHGMGGNMSNFATIGFHPIADTANFIVITPQALVDPLTNSTSWNADVGQGNFKIGANFNDIGFFQAIIDTLAQTHNIDLERIYSTGFSMGGYMSNKLACTMNYRFAATASVAGTFGNFLNCNPGRDVAVAHFHGTEDQVVPYQGNQFGTNVQHWLDFWANNNSCATATYDSVAVPNIALDGYNITKFFQSNCNNTAAEIEFYKVYNAEHEWLFTPANDISYCVEVWRFLSRQRHPAPAALSILEEKANKSSFSSFPNPSAGLFSIKLPEDQTFNGFQVIALDGRVVVDSNQELIGESQINLSHLAKGTYLLRLKNALGMVDRLVIK